MKDPRPQPIFRKDYRPPDYWIDAADLRFELSEDACRVTATLQIRRNAQSGEGPRPLVLHGERLTLLALELDGQPLAADAYSCDDRTLRITSVPASFTLRSVVELRPQDNTELSGLFRTGSSFCTQCEAEGFRRITYFLDRPDVMARFTTEIVADAERYPVLLSNGNRVAEGKLPDGRHFVRWEDPYPKPSYLFAIVAANLECHTGSFTTRSGRDVRLEFWVEPRNVEACAHALASLQRAMRWDEEVYGLEYDLDVYMVVAVSDFNMAAMENKGLNIFNAKYVLARPETATDEDYEDIEGVIAHEYFHNWTGNRVTCRDWFQLTLKEGLTVFRDESFSADMGSPAVKRIQDVRLLRTTQFAEDQSPTAHPIRPESYIEMNNFYTVTVYNKGAEVVRMFQTLLGKESFRRGMDLYFRRHDGQAVTCDDFQAAMADASGADLEQFGLWYSQAGTPILEVEPTYDPAAQTYAITLRQRPPVHQDATKYRSMQIPVAVGLVGAQGRDLPLDPGSPGVLRVERTTAILDLRAEEQVFTFRNVREAPVLSVLRGFSAPVKVRIQRSFDELAFLMRHDTDAFCRWDAAQSLAEALLLDLCRDASLGSALALDRRFIESFGAILCDEHIDGSLKALTLRLPDERLLGQQQKTVDVDGLRVAHSFACHTLGHAHMALLMSTYAALAQAGPYRHERATIDQRQLKNLCLSYLVETGEEEAIRVALAQLLQADNMTDAQAALVALCNLDHPARDEGVAEFYKKWRHEPLVLDKWFAAQASSAHYLTFDRVEALTRHPDFTLKNPNRARALLGTFAVRNQARFHGADGRGYSLIATKVLELDRTNPQVAARLMGAFGQWRRFDAGRRALMRRELRRIVEQPHLSPDVYELASKSLGEPEQT